MYLNITKPSKREERGGGGIFVTRTKLITLNSTLWLHTNQASPVNWDPGIEK